MAETAIRFKGVDIIFGNAPQKAFPLIDQGLSRTEIAEQTDQIVGCAQADLDVEQGGGIACHTGRESCLFRVLRDGQWETVDPVLKDPAQMYTGKPADDGPGQDT